MNADVRNGRCGVKILEDFGRYSIRLCNRLQDYFGHARKCVIMTDIIKQAK